MGVVYRAEDPAIGRTVAIKTIRLGELTESSERDFMRERLLREARSAGILSHPGIVTIYDIFEEGDTAYIFMEFVNGETLEERTSTGEMLDRGRVFDILRQTATALDYAHGKGIVHRDIKPANIMISVDGEAKITDFGVAKILSQQMTQTRSVLGTPYYMSPEQIQGGRIDGRSDQFALAVIAFELMTGERPYTADSLPTLLFKIVKETPPPPRRLNPSLAEEVGAVFEKAFAKEPEDRFGSCTEFVNALAVAAAKNPAWEPLPHGHAGSIETVATNPPLPPPPAEQDPDATRVAPPPALPHIPKTRDREVLLEDEGSTLARNVVLVVLLFAVLAGAYYGYLNYFSSAPAEPPEAAGAVVPPLTETAAASHEKLAQPRNDAAASMTEAAPEAANPVPPEPPKATPPPEDAAPAAAAVTPAKVAPTKVTPPKVTPLKAAPPKPSPNQEYWVQIRSTPPGARVTVDDDSELKCKTPCELPLRTGRHVVKVSLAGHRMSPRIIQVPEITDLTVQLDRNVGTLAISSDPPGAAIYVNGELRAEKTPAMIKLPAGDYKIRLSLPGRQDFEDTVTVRDQVISRIGVDW